MQLPSALIPFFDAAQEKLNPLIEYLSANPISYDAFIVLLLALVAFLFLRLARKKPLQTASLTHADNADPKDINAIAGDDVVSTQLDLAKAYIEMNQKKIAKEMLNAIIKIGSSHQKNEARLLIQSL
jgi:FimV-like protein